MRIQSIDIFPLAIAFRLTFRHALASRDAMSSLIVRVRDEQGRAGYGECAPRSYVSGEDADSAHRTIEQRLSPPWRGAEFAAFDDVIAALRDAQGRVKRDEHAAFCAMELAILDLAGRTFGRSAADVLGPVTRPGIQYSGVVSADSPERTREFCEAYRKMRLPAVKMKVGSSLDNDLANLSVAREILGDACSLRVDANGAWSADEALQRIEQMQRFRIEAVEQPVAADDIAGLTHVTAASNVPIIVDESLISFADAMSLIEARACHMFNIRVSKNGGLIGAARLRETALQHGLDWMLGAQVGESAILSAAGRHLATRGAPPRWCEGSFGTLLLERDIARENLTFGPGGAAPAIEGPGLGITIDNSALEPQPRAQEPKPEPSTTGGSPWAR